MCEYQRPCTSSSEGEKGVRVHIRPGGCNGIAAEFAEVRVCLGVPKSRCGLRCLRGRFRTARAQCAHSANYYGDYLGNSPENHPPAESCTINSNLKNSNI